MEKTAKTEGYYREAEFGRSYDKIQIITVEDLLGGRYPNIPTSSVTIFKRAEKESTQRDTQTKLF